MLREQQRRLEVAAANGSSYLGGGEMKGCSPWRDRSVTSSSAGSRLVSWIVHPFSPTGQAIRDFFRRYDITSEQDFRER